MTLAELLVATMIGLVVLVLWFMGWLVVCLITEGIREITQARRDFKSWRRYERERAHFHKQYEEKRHNARNTE